MASVVLFDGVCNFCNGFVRFAIRWLRPESRDALRFAAGQSETGRRLVADARLDSNITERTVVLLPGKGGRPLLRSSAILTVAAHLRFPWWLLARVGWAVPERLRDGVYDWVAAHRYAVFGKRDSCVPPEPGQRGFFLE